MPNITFLGHIVGRIGIQLDPFKTEKIKNFPIPTDLTSLRAALGLFSYYRKFIKDFPKIARPLNSLLKKGTPFIWTNDQQQAFDYLKNQLIQAPILQYPDFDKEFIVYTDASGTGLGAVLFQKDENGRERVIAYASRSLNKHEQNYGITDQEGLAVIWAIKHFHHYLCLKHFTVVTDHPALKFLKTSQIPTGRRGRWMMELQQHNFSIIHRPGKNNANADALSRIPEKEVHILMVETRASKRRRLASEITNPISYPYDEEDDLIEWVDYTNRLTLGNSPAPEEDEPMPDSPMDPYYEDSSGGWGSDEGDHDNLSQA